MNSEPAKDQRRRADRRRHPTSLWNAFRRGGRRAHNRRAREHRRAYFVDRFPTLTLVFILILLFLTIADGVLTLHLLERDCEELNPVMAYLLDRGVKSFILGKYLLTATGLPFLVTFQNHYLLGTRFRVGYLIPLFAVPYIALLCYQLWLLS